jgi:hypothetical protein
VPTTTRDEGSAPGEEKPTTTDGEAPGGSRPETTDPPDGGTSTTTTERPGEGLLPGDGTTTPQPNDAEDGSAAEGQIEGDRPAG